MKNLILAAVLLLCSLAQAEETKVPEKVLLSFKKSFPEARAINWGQNNNHYQVYFEMQQASYRLQYDREGRLKTAIKYYTAPLLAPFIKGKIKEAYPNASIFGITEVMTEETMFYEVVLEDKTHWTKIHSDASGHLNRIKKFRKA